MSATSIPCPHCDGDGFTEDGIMGPCAVCADDSGNSEGYLDLPLTQEQANRIYDAGCSCCQHLVSGDYDITEVYLPPEARPIVGPIPFPTIDDDDTLPLIVGK